MCDHQLWQQHWTSDEAFSMSSFLVICEDEVGLLDYRLQLRPWTIAKQDPAAEIWRKSSRNCEELFILSNNYVRVMSASSLNDGIAFRVLVSCVPVFLQTLPRPFVEAHGDKFRKSVVLRNGNKTWSLRISIFPSRSPPEVTLCAGWRRFVYDNGLTLGDKLIFHLKAMSSFDVYIFNSRGESKVPQVLRADVTETSQQKVNKSLRRTKREKLTTEEVENLIYESYHGRSRKRADDSKKIPTALPAAFKKQLRHRPGDCVLEIPAHFVRKYGNLLRRRLRVQGILEDSPVQIIGCAYFMNKGRFRFYLQDGWDEFWKDNMLRDRQELIFTIVSDSFFKVRVVNVS